MSDSVTDPSAGSRERAILDAFIDLADSLVADYDPLDFLYRLLDHSIPLTEADAGAVLLHYEGRLHLVASSDEDAQAVELFEVQNEQGPARDAFHGGELVRVPRMSDATDRWPEFVEAAAPYGWSSVFAVPLRLRDHTVGSFVAFWPGKMLNEQDAKVLRGFADVAAIAVLQQRATADVEMVNKQLHTALETRINIEQAKGMIAQATGVRMGEAFEMLRRHARSKSTRVTNAAASVVAGDVDIHVLTRH